MDVREKLVVLLSEKCMETCKQRKGYVCSVEECKRSKEKCCGFYADHLISNGVTVQEWISVEDRLPSDEQDVLVIAHGWDGRLVYVGSHKRVEAKKSWLTGITNKSSEWLLWGWSYLKEPMVTHWMPLPQPPEGE